MKRSISLFALFSGPIAFILFYLFISIPNLDPAAQAMLALAVWMAIWWISETLPIAVTAMLPLIILPLLDILPIKTVSANYMHPTVMLYMGGFLLATGIEKWNLHRRIALSIISVIGTNLRTIVLGFSCATGLLSMWISNSATSLMMLPIGLAVVKQFEEQLRSNEPILAKNLGKNIMLGIAYSASIGGIATIVGTPTNAIMVAVIEDLYGYTINFYEWFYFGLPISILLIGICWWYLVSYANPLPPNYSLNNASNIVNEQLKSLGRMKFEEWIVLIVFGLVCFSWIFRKIIWEPIFPAINDTIIVLVGVVLLFILPDSTGKDKILDWKTAERIPWGVLILFGGGLALAEGFQETGLATWLGQQFTLIDGVAFILLLLIIVASVNFLTEVTSNVATASMLLPILASVALQLNLHPYGLMVGASLAASCAFMLPVATPPNAIVFGSGMLQMKDMVRAGFWMNLISIALITLLVYFLLPLLWKIDLQAFPF